MNITSASHSHKESKSILKAIQEICITTKIDESIDLGLFYTLVDNYHGLPFPIEMLNELKDKGYNVIQCKNGLNISW